MLAGGAHIEFVSPPSPANESRRWPERLPLFWAVLSWLLIAGWGWLVFALLFAAFSDLGSAAMNFVSTNIFASIS